MNASAGARASARSVQQYAIVSPSGPQSTLDHDRSVARVEPPSVDRSTRSGSCQQIDGFQSSGDSPDRSASACSAQPAPPAKPGRLRNMHAPSTTRVLRIASLSAPPAAISFANCACSASSVVANAEISIASSSSSNSAPTEQHPSWASTAASASIPAQPRSQMHVQFDDRNAASTRHVVSPSGTVNHSLSIRSG